MIDKVQRINSFTNDKELSVSNETVEDACDDIVNYAILGFVMIVVGIWTSLRLAKQPD